MDTVEKLKTINYVCNTCPTWRCMNCGLNNRNEEDKYECCEYLRVRIRNIDKSLNNAVYADEIKSMSDPSRVAHYAERRAKDDL